MKLAAAILFAVTNAQRDGRQREKETPSESDDAFASYFGADGDYGNAFGDYNAFGAESFGDNYEVADAFGDLTFGDYDGDYAGETVVDTANIEQAVAADEANRPTNDDQDDGKTFLPGDTSASANQNDASFAAYCWENSASKTATSAEVNWATSGGSWKQCTGNGSACEVKVVRNLEDNNNIVQITSKCANEDSCLANMEQNFNPKRVTGTRYQSFLHQSCRPKVLGSFNTAVGARFSSNNERSTCFFCVEPCAAADPTDTKCVGPDGQGGVRSAPSNASGVNIFLESTLKTNGGANPNLGDNYYSTTTGTLTNVATGATRVMKVSNIQAQQLNNNAASSFA